MAAGFWARRLCAAVGASICASVCALALSAAFAPPASAQLFSDDEARARLDDHQKQLKQFADHIVELRKQGGALREQIGEQLNAMNQKLDATNRQLGRISQRLQKAESEIRQLRGAQQEQDENRRRESTGESAAVQARFVATEEQLAELRELLESIRQESATVARDVAELSAIIPLPPEQELYDAAFAEFQGQRYQSALDGFRRVQKFYPDGRFQVNVGYWISNTLLALEDYEAVIVAAQDMISRHPGSDRTPDVMLFMAQAYSQLGRAYEARRVLRRIVDEHPTSLAADKARQKLQG